MKITPPRALPRGNSALSEMISVSQLAERWSIHRNSIYGLIERTHDPLPARRLGRAWRIVPAEAEEWSLRQSNRSVA